MSTTSLAFNPPLKAAEIVGTTDPKHATPEQGAHAWGECPDCLETQPPTGKNILGGTMALIGLVVDIEMGTGQAIVVNPMGVIEWREPDSLELFIEF